MVSFWIAVHENVPILGVGEALLPCSSLPLLSSPHPCCLSHTEPCKDTEHNHSKQQEGCRERFMWAQLNLWNDNSWPKWCGAIKITMCILSLFWGSHVSWFKALAVVSVHYKSCGPYASVCRCSDWDITCYDCTLPNCEMSQARDMLTSTNQELFLIDADRHNK